MSRTDWELASIVTSTAARLAGASNLDDIGDILVGAALAMGAAAAAVAVLEGSDLVLVRSAGYSPHDEASIPRRPYLPGAGLPLADNDQSLGVLEVAWSGEAMSSDVPRTALAHLACVAGAAIARARHAAMIEERLRHAQRLLGVVCHDLRSPLGAILLATETLARGPHLRSSDRRLIGSMSSSVKLASRLVHDLLDQTRIELAGGLAVERRPDDLFSILRHAVADAQEGARSRCITLAIDGKGDGAWDSERATQIFANLVSNALIHSPADAPVDIVAEGRRGDRVYVEVRSYGAPIAPDRIGRLFEPLEQGDSPRRRERGSMGLGLFIVRQLVEEHGGRVWVTSSSDEGTAFVVEMPRATGVSLTWQGDGDAGVAVVLKQPVRPTVQPLRAAASHYESLLSHFTNHQLGRLLRHWLALGGAAHLPHPRSLDRVKLGDLLPEMLFARVVAGQDKVEFRYREVGGAIERRLGRSLAGTLVPRAAEDWSAESAASYDSCLRCLELRRPIYDFARFALDGNCLVAVERLTIPLSDDGGRTVTDLVSLARIDNLLAERRLSPIAVGCP